MVIPMSRIDKLRIFGLNYKELNFVIEYAKDFDPRRAANVSGYKASKGTDLLQLDKIQRAIDNILENRLQASDIDAEWLLMQAVDNHMLARYRGNLAASNTALSIIAKHKNVGANVLEDNSADQVVINIDGKLLDV